jgi:type II secretory pathway pseudopilin PulG
MPATDRAQVRARARAGFTAIELMVVVSIIIMLVAMTVPSIFPAIRKGRVHDAANAILKVASQARQLARSRPQPAQTAGGAVPLYFYGVAVVVPASGPAYAVLTYDNSSPNGAAPGAVGRLADNSTTTYMSKQAFNANVMPFNSILNAGGGGAKAVYGLQARGTKIGWYYQYRTGFVLRNDQPPLNGNYPLTQLGSIGTAAVAANPLTGAPAVAAYPPNVFGVCSLDQQYVVAMSIYSIGLANAQDLF